MSAILAAPDTSPGCSSMIVNCKQRQEACEFMKLHSLKISGFMGFSPDAPLLLPKFGHLNVLTGPNNSGKSSVFRFLRHIQSIASQFKKDDVREISGSSFTIVEHMHWQRDKTVPIKGTLTFLSNEFETSFPKAVWDSEERCGVELWFENKNVGLEPHWYNIASCMRAKVYPFFAGLQESHSFVMRQAMREWAVNARFFDPIRSLDRTGRSGAIDGSIIVKDLYNKREDTSRSLEYECLIEFIGANLSELLEYSGTPTISNLEVRGTADNPTLWIRSGRNFVPIESLGTGIVQLIVLFAYLALDKDKEATYFLEEPETHLHPGLLKRLIAKLKRFSNIQFFISSHSSAILDCLSDDDAVYLLRQEVGGACHAITCTAFTEQFRILDLLGVSSRDTLQSNCTIWVEGPTDRIYVRQWIKEAQKSYGTALELVEGSDYSIVSYGGKLLSHFGLEIGDRDLIEVMKVNRFNAVLMDRDKPPGSTDKDLSETKRRILSEASEDPWHFFASATVGREIENDVPSKLLFSAIAEELKMEAKLFDGIQLTGEMKFADEIVVKAALDAAMKDKINDGKLSIAKRVIDLLSEENSFVPLPTYIKPLVDLILRARKPDEHLKRKENSSERKT